MILTLRLTPLSEDPEGFEGPGGGGGGGYPLPLGGGLFGPPPG